MFKTFQNRGTLATLAVSFFLLPFGGMLYLGRGWKAIIYLLAYILPIVALVAYWQSFNTPISLYHAILITALVIRIIGTIDCVIIARRKTYQLTKWYARWYWVILLSLLVHFGFAAAFRTYIYKPFDMPTVSMTPTINQGDYFFVQKFDRVNLKHGDIIVFKKTLPHNSYYCKRIIGLPGDKITYKNGIFTINGTQLTQTAIGENYFEAGIGNYGYKILLDKQDFTQTSFPESYQVPADGYFVAGDNRSNSMDSRFPEFGYVSKTEIEGKVVLDISRKNGQYFFKKF